jgi:hypothetical protein
LFIDLDQLEPLLKVSSIIDPTFDPIRNNLRFKRLLQGTA